MSAHKGPHQIGVIAEQKSVAFLRRHGFVVIQQRFKVRHGEIDIIASEGRLLVFIEVKARDTYEQAMEAVTQKTRRRIVAASEIWLQRHSDYNDYDQRFDIIVILPQGILHHVPDAFRPGD